MVASRSNRVAHRLALTSLALGLLVASCAAVSYWWAAGHSRLDQAWVFVPASGMAELHSQRRGWSVAHGKAMWVVDEFISAVVPRGTAEDNPASSSSEWFLMSAPPERDRAWDSRRFYTNWHEWRLWSLGWYTTTGGASTSRVLSVPLWLPALLLALPGAWLWRRRRTLSRRLRAGACWSCGYAGVGQQPGARCPECGATRPA